jgi:mannan endo-1,4-beta-mannosidase
VRSRDGLLRCAARAMVVVTAAAAIAAMAGCSALTRGGTKGVATTGTGSTTSAVATQSMPAPPVPLPLAGKVQPPVTGAYLGVYAPPSPFTISPLESFEAAVGKKTAILMWYQPWAPNNRPLFDTGSVVAIMRRGKVPMITWEPWNPGKDARLVPNATTQRTYRLANILAGDFDAYMRRWARDIHAFGGPVMLRPMHEMNGNWYPWDGTVNGNTPAQYVAAWRRMHDIFEQEGATNVTWVWSINHESVPATPENAYGAYYPGDKYVDWVGISGFNWGTSTPDNSWQTFDHWYQPPLTYLKTLNKPVVIAEFASVENGGDKAAWITDAYARIQQQYPEVKAVIWYEANEHASSSSQDWPVDSSAASLAAFRQAIAPQYFTGDAPAALSSWGGSLNDGDRRYLSYFTPLY